MHALYFAYGSNLHFSRMRERVPSAQAAGPGRLRGWRLSTDKRGRDGSGKANLRPDPSASVWGVVYRIAAVEWPRLDACEGDYTRVRVAVRLRSGETLGAETYRSRRLTVAPVLAASYKRLLVAGARQHRLPPEWIARLLALPERG